MTEKDELSLGFRIGVFVRGALPDFLLVLIVSACLVDAGTYAFNSALHMQGNYWLCVALCLVPLLVLFAGSWSKKAMLPAGIALAVVIVIYLVVGLRTSSASLFVSNGFTEVGTTDLARNNIIFAMVAIAMPIVVFFLSRRPVFMVVLIIFSLIVVGVVQYLYRDFFTDAYGDLVAIVMVIGIAALMVYQTYRQSVYQAKRSHVPRFFGAWAFSLLIGVVCVAVGIGIFYGVVQGSGLKTPDWRPFIEEVSAPVIEYNGVYKRQDIKDPDNFTDKTNKSQTTTQKNKQDRDTHNSSKNSGQEGGLSSLASGLHNVIAGYDKSDEKQEYNQFQWFLFKYGPIIIAICCVLALILLILLQIMRRERRLKKIANEPAAYQIWFLYTFIVGRMWRFKIRRPEYMTPMEFAMGSGKTMASFNEGTQGIDFVEITRVYERCCYGGVPVTSEDHAKLVVYYRAFFKNARKRAGFRWIWKFWRI